MEPLLICKNTKHNSHEKAALYLSEYTQWPLLLTAVLFGAGRAKTGIAIMAWPPGSIWCSRSFCSACTRFSIAAL